MKGSALLVLLAVGCGGEGMRPDMPPGEPLPDGVWEPVPGADVWYASVAADGDRLWWATTQRRQRVDGALFKDAIWMSATSLGGESIVAAAEVAPGSASMFDPDVVVTPSAVVAKLGGVETLLRRYDRDGTPLGAAYPVTIAADHVNVNDMDLIATAGGASQLVASLQSDTADVAIVELDAAGVVGTTRIAGTPDTLDGGTTAGTIAAAARPDGTTLVAWDRGYNGCISTRPSSTLTTSVDATTVATIQTVRDLPDSEAHPAIATSGAGAYLTWLSYSAEGSRIALARYPDVTTAIAEVVDPDHRHELLALALSGPDRGVIAWLADEATMRVVRFEDRAGTVQLGTPVTIPLVDADAGVGMLDVVHVGDDRFVFAWIESRFVGLDTPHRLYATELAPDAALRPAPAVVPATSASVRRLRCP